MRASNPFARALRLEGSARVSPQGSIGGHGASTFSRRDLMRAGAAGLVGLGIPIAAPLQAFAGICFPGANILYEGGSEAKPNNPFVQQGLTVSFPSLSNGQVCVTATNNTGVTLVLVQYFNDAPNALLFDCFQSSAFSVGETLMALQPFVLPADGVPHQLCMSVPNLCLFQADVGLFQWDAAAFQADLFVQNPGAGGVPVGIPVPLTDQNIIAGLLVGGGCPNPPPACIRMTGGGHGMVLTVGGITVTTKEGFELRAGGKSNLELHWTINGVDHVFKVGPGDTNTFVGAFTPCPGGGGGGQPLNNPNTILGTTTGSLDGNPGVLFLNFVDCGEPGTNDTRQFIIYDNTTSPPTPLLLASGVIQNGNNQAHMCNG
jgi:hypothetical protein